MDRDADAPSDVTRFLQVAWLDVDLDPGSILTEQSGNGQQGQPTEEA
jgi:hypothetical protein